MNDERQDQQLHVSIPVNKDGKPLYVSYATYSDTVADKQWVIKKLVRAIIIIVCLMFVSNIAWLVAWLQYDYSSTETTLESDGNSIANYTGGDGGVVYGVESDSTQDNPDETQ